MLRCEDVRKEFTLHLRGGKRVAGLSGVSFDLEPGSFLGVSGPSGAGKSTLLKCIYRTYLPTGGRIAYTRADGTVVDMASADERTCIEIRRTEIGCVSQFFQVIPRVSALDTITNEAVRRGADRTGSEERARELLARLRIPRGLWELYPSTFSGGEKQRINVIRAVIASPRLLLMDEPTASLDSASAREAIALIRELKDRGTAMIGVFHDRELLARLSDRELEIPAGEPS
jgi:alpha-D-ribose 1-methylphosphonate 5-triphosphate synthase subunit PhnL